MKPKVSIITVTYNCKDKLQLTLNSVFNQSFKDWEQIVIDGKSQDGTVDVIKSNQDKISYWISEKDGGVYDAMNKGLKAAKGEYVLFLNAGDTFYSKYSLGRIPFIDQSDADIFYGETIIVNEEGKQLGLRQKKLPHNLTWRHFKDGMVVCHQSILVKRELAPEYVLSYRYSADIDWVLLSLKRARKIIFTNSIISVFETGGFSAQNKWNSWLERWTIMKNYFGWTQCLLSHIVFIFELFILKLGLKPAYRNIDSKLLSNEEHS